MLRTTYSVVNYTGQTIMGRHKIPPTSPTWSETINDLAILPGVGGTDVGGRVGTAAPTFEAFGITYRGAPRTWRTRGGTRLGPVVEEDSLTNNLIPAALAALQLAGQALSGPLVLALGGAQLTRVVYSQTNLRRAENPVVFPASFISPVVAFNVNTFVTTQVSRKQRAQFGQ
jgi:hypothetical protein